MGEKKREEVAVAKRVGLVPVLGLIPQFATSAVRDLGHVHLRVPWSLICTTGINSISLSLNDVMKIKHAKDRGAQILR